MSELEKSKPSDIELAWAAGFFDGEGCVILRKSNNTYAVRISVSQVNPTPINKLKKLFGGHICFQKSKNDNWNDQWKWEQDSKSGASTLELLLPFLVVKKDVAELAIEFQRLKRKGSKVTVESIEKELLYKKKISDINQRD